MKKLNGAWEPKGYIGPRAEIKGCRLVRLWRGAVVLDTGFAARPQGESVELELAERGLRHAPGEEPYAVVKVCRYENGTLTMVDDFPITGESTEVLYPTENSRYGDAEEDRKALALLRGEWIGSEGTRLRFRGRTMQCAYGDEPWRCAEQVVVLRRRSDGEVTVRSRDPAKDMLGFFAPLRWQGDTLATYVPVCDAPSVQIVFTRKDRKGN